MQTDWLELWRELIIAKPHSPDSEPIKRYKKHARQKRQRPDPLLDFVLQSIDSNLTVLDIGAGDGRWTIPLAAKARSVTAVEPSAEMLELLIENSKVSGVNISTIQSSWEEAGVEVHDVAVCVHAIYSSPDFSRFIRKMEHYATKTCYLVIRLPPADGVIGRLSGAIHGCLHDSVNAVVAYNALYSLGIYANVMVESDIHHWTDNSLEEAFVRAKRHLQLDKTSTWDELIRDMLERCLVRSGNGYIWPDGMRSALLWWSPLSVV